MGNIIGKCCGFTFEYIGEFWSVHGIPLHFIAMFSIICVTGVCPWLAMLGFIPLSYLATKFIKREMKKSIKKRSEKKQLKLFLKELYNSKYSN